jgi:hypothetical protein
MKHNFYFSGKDINLAQSVASVINDMQQAIDQFFPSPNTFVQVADYKELDADTFEMRLKRGYAKGAGTALPGFICDNDMSLLTGLAISAFQPFPLGNKPLLAPLCPWYDNMVYAPDRAFTNLWEHQNDVMIHEKIKRISVYPSVADIYIKVTYGEKKSRGQKKNSSKGKNNGKSNGNKKSSKKVQG